MLAWGCNITEFETVMGSEYFLDALYIEHALQAKTPVPATHKQPDQYHEA